VPDAEPHDTETAPAEPQESSEIVSEEEKKDTDDRFTVDGEHPDDEFTPSTLGKLLDRSPGAIFNALQKLIEFGAAVQTSEKPRTYKAAEA
jgi:hypothetical protein